MSIYDYPTIREIKEYVWDATDIVFDIKTFTPIEYKISKITTNTDCYCLSVNKSFCNQFPKIDIPISIQTNPQRKQCPFIKIKDDELEILRTRLSNVSNVAIYDNLEYKICLNEFTFPSQSSDVRYTVDIVLTYGCFAFSAVCCLIFIVIFIKVPTIRTLPTSTITNLVVCTMLVQIVYVSGVGIIEYPTVCKIIGMVLHYLWLCNFTWSVLCCIHMVRVFRRIQLSTVAFGRKTLIKYMVAGYMVPVLYITPFIIGEFCNCFPTKIEYGGNVCFVNTNDAIFYALDVPVLVSLLVNICLFIVIFKTIKCQTLIQKNTSKKEKRRFFVILRLVSAMNFSWILGMIAKWTNIDPVWYAFTVANGLQGTFLMLSFITWNDVLQAISCREVHNDSSRVAPTKRRDNVGCKIPNPKSMSDRAPYLTTVTACDVFE